MCSLMILLSFFTQICTLAVRESLANVRIIHLLSLGCGLTLMQSVYYIVTMLKQWTFYSTFSLFWKQVFGDQFESFVRNFEKSFHSTLMTLRIISESSMSSGVPQHNGAARTSVSERSMPFVSNRVENVACYPYFSDFQSESFQQSISDNELSNQEERSDATCLESIGRQLTLYDRQVRQQLASASSSMISSNTEICQSVHRTLERSLTEQARSNDLKTFEIDLTMRKLQLKERQLALSSDANFLERAKLSYGFSKTSFKTQKFKNQVEDSKHAELLKTCIDCLVAGLFIMLACLGYGTYVFSHKKITEATASCTPSTVRNIRLNSVDFV